MTVHGGIVKCPWCGDDGFDLIGLKAHIQKNDCPVFESTWTLAQEYAERRRQKLMKAEDDQ